MVSLAGPREVRRRDGAQSEARDPAVLLDLLFPRDDYTVVVCSTSERDAWSEKSLDAHATCQRRSVRFVSDIISAKKSQRHTNGRGDG